MTSTLVPGPRRGLRSISSRMSRWLSRRVERARHNDFDDACDYWFGDRSPEVQDRRNREFIGDATTISVRRCLRCRPHDVESETDLLDLPEP
jgi:hypothetical protein